MQYYRGLRPRNPSEYPDDSEPTFAVMGKYLAKEHLMFAVSMPLMEVRDWFNVSYNLTDSQIAMLAEAIPQRYWYYTLSELKGALYVKMREGKVYNRIDPNTVMGWIAEYDLKRDQASEDAAIQGKNASLEDSKYLTMEEYEASLRGRAEAGEQTAIELLEKVRGFKKRMKGLMTDDERRKKEIEFRLFKHRYNKNKSGNEAE